jgi:hypothetical protein
MKVKVTQPAFFGGVRRRVGEVLEVPAGTKGAWFVEVPSGASTAPADKAKKPKSADSAPVALSELGKTKSVGPLDLI